MWLFGGYPPTPFLGGFKGNPEGVSPPTKRSQILCETAEAEPTRPTTSPKARLNQERGPYCTCHWENSRASTRCDLRKRPHESHQQVSPRPVLRRLARQLKHRSSALRESFCCASFVTVHQLGSLSSAGFLCPPAEVATERPQCTDPGPNTLVLRQKMHLPAGGRCC